MTLSKFYDDTTSARKELPLKYEAIIHEVINYQKKEKKNTELITMSKPQNPLFQMIHNYPIASIVAVPVIVNLGTTWIAMFIRKGKTGSYFRGVGSVFAPKEELSPMAGLGKVRTEGGIHST